MSYASYVLRILTPSPKSNLDPNPNTTKTSSDPNTTADRELGDVDSACELLNHYLDQYALHPVFTVDDFRHWLMPREAVTVTPTLTVII